MNALERGANYLSIKPRSSKEVEDYLKKKGYSREEISEAIKELSIYHYIDDFKYAGLYIKYGLDKGRGMDRIRRELMAKGVDVNTVDDVIYQLEEDGELPDQFELALQIGKTAVEGVDMGALDYREKSKLKGRIARRLQSRGFGNDIIYSVLNRLSL